MHATQNELWLIYLCAYIQIALYTPGRQCHALGKVSNMCFSKKPKEIHIKNEK